MNTIKYYKNLGATIIIAAIFAVAVLLTSCMPSQGDKSREVQIPTEIALDYFYDEICASCDATAEFDSVVEEQLDGVRELHPFVIRKTNLYQNGGKDSFRAACENMGLDYSTITLPALFINGKVLQGEEAIEKNIREAFLVAGEDYFENKTVYNPKDKKTGQNLFDDYSADPKDITVVYFYRITCEECEQTKPVIENLPDSVIIDGTARKLTLIKINTRSGNNNERISAFFEAYNLPDEDRTVPIVFLNSEYLAGYEQISEQLEEAILKKENLGFDFKSLKFS